MKFYFLLQWTRLSRWFKEKGVYPILGVILSAIVFVGLSKMLFYKISYASWVYVSLGWFYTFKFCDESRNSNLRQIFKDKDRRIVRLLENGFLAIPFFIFLCIEGNYIFAIVFFLGALLLSFVVFNFGSKFVIPTPFRKYPFDSIVGFRKTFLIIIALYLLLMIAVHVGNYNLGLVSYGSLYLSAMSFYLKPEPPYFVNIFSYKTLSFLRHKIINAVICAIILGLPAFLILNYFFLDKWFLCTLVTVGGLIFLVTSIFAKYSEFPQEIKLIPAFMFSLCFIFPPLLLLIMPMFYFQAKKKLEPHLG